MQRPTITLNSGEYKQPAAAFFKDDDSYESWIIILQEKDGKFCSMELIPDNYPMLTLRTFVSVTDVRSCSKKLIEEGWEVMKWDESLLGEGIILDNEEDFYVSEGEEQLEIEDETLGFSAQKWINSEEDDSKLTDNQKLICIDYAGFDVFEDCNGLLRVEDREKGNLGDIESERFDSLSEIISRMTVYWQDLQAEYYIAGKHEGK